MHSSISGHQSPGKGAVRNSAAACGISVGISRMAILNAMPASNQRLENGLRVVLNKDESIPVVSIAVYYDVGSRNEREGRTGFAHLFEHMMFQGSENVKKAEHFQFIMKAGGTMNGTTSSERTNYL